MNGKSKFEIRITIMNNESNNYINFVDLDVYKLAVEYSDKVWQIYNVLNNEHKILVGYQLMKSVDSVGANIAEGYGRFYYLDKVRFYYNARGSLVETKHWVDILLKRLIINNIQHEEMINLYNQIYIKLNALIKSQYRSKNK